MTVWNIITDLTKLLSVCFIEQPQAEARLIVCDVLNLSTSRYIAAKNDPITDEDYQKCVDIAGLRLTGRSLASILGYRYFYEDKFIVSDDVLIPRPETEMLVDYLLQQEHSPKQILEIGLGSGCITVSVAKHRPSWSFLAVEISAKAAAIATQNAQNILSDISNIRIVNTDFMSFASNETFDIIVSNPPYIPSNVTKDLLDGKTISDPEIALDGGPDGLDFYRAILSFADSHLSPTGIVVVEHGFDQRNALSELAGWHNLSYSCYRDLAGLDRMSVFKKNK